MLSVLEMMLAEWVIEEVSFAEGLSAIGSVRYDIINDLNKR